MNILLTDSGLGGLSVCADIERKIRNTKTASFDKLEIKYVNAIPKTHDGYNTMDSRSEQIEVFNRFLYNASELYSPGAIYIVCNTLSAIYTETDFSKETSLPVNGIINIGIDLLIKSYNKLNNAAIIILAADTTINENIYENQLVKQGITHKFIISQACTNLANTISNDPSGNDVKELIDRYLSTAISKVPTNCDAVLVYLGCTHYGYRREIFEMILNQISFNYQIINPNYSFLDIIFDNSIWSTNLNNQIIPSIEFITHYPIPKREVDTLTKYLSALSPQTAKAIQNYIIEPDIF